MVTIFTYKTNKADLDADGLIGEPDFEVNLRKISTHSRDKLESSVEDYNPTYPTLGAFRAARELDVQISHDLALVSTYLF